MSDRISSRNNQSSAALRDRPFFRRVTPVVKLAVLAWLAVCLQAAASAQTTETWNGQDGNGLWSDGNNWTPSTAQGGPNGNYNVWIPVTGNPQPVLDVSATINNLQIDQLESLTIINGTTLTVTGPTILNSGTLALNPNSGGPGGKLNITNATTLSGFGTVQIGLLTDFIVGPGTLTNQQTISGFGAIQVATLNNQGQILGTSSTIGLEIESSTLTNSGLISTLDFGTVTIAAPTVQNAGGRISGGGGHVTLYGCSVMGGQLGGTIYAGSFAPTLNGVTITGNYFINSIVGTSAQTFLAGTITNIGSITVNGPPGALKAELTINSAATLTGTGSVSLNGQNAFLDGSGTLTNTQSISGTGSANITVNQLANPGGTVTSSSGLTIQVPGGFNNAGGTLGTAVGSTLHILDTPVSGGTISTDTSSAVVLGGASILIATTFSGPGTSFGVNATLNGTPITNGSTIEVDSNNVTTLQGTINNNGVMSLNGSCLSCPPAKLWIPPGIVTLNGNGTISLSNSPLNVIVSVGQNAPSQNSPGGSDSLTNNGNTIEGAGTIGPLSLTNGAKGAIIADQGYPLIISTGARNTFRNSGTLSAGTPLEPSSTLEITGGKFSNFNLITQTLTGGTYNVSGTLQFD